MSFCVKAKQKTTTNQRHIDCDRCNVCDPGFSIHLETGLVSEGHKSESEINKPDH